MKDSLVPGIEETFSFVIPEDKTVPHLYPESPEFQAMPPVFATGFMVGLLEWTCIRAIQPHIEAPAEQTLGTHIDVSHSAATPPGLTVTVRVRLDEVAGRRLRFTVSAHDGVDDICRGTHERFVIDVARFQKKMATKRGR